jgi:hypothetical protein
MFSINPPQIKYFDPWNAPFADRLGRLARGNLRVAYYYEHPDSSSFRYRVYNMVQAMDLSGGQLAGAYFFEYDKGQMQRVIAAADILVLCRSRYTPMLAGWIQQAQSQSKRVFFDIDDDIADLERLPSVIDSLDMDITNPVVLDQLYAYAGRLAAVMRLCDAILTTNETLATFLQKQTGKPVAVAPNFLNCEQLTLSQQIFAQKKKAGFPRTAHIHLGYFSGSPTHNKDFDVVADALLQMLADDPRIRLRIMGYMNLPKPFARFRNRVEHLPLADFLHLQARIAEVEWNLIPLQDNDFTRCKSDLKYFEAGIAGTLSIATPLPVYAKIIHAGENGWLARSFEWEHVLHTAIGAIADYPRMAEKAYEDCEDRYAPQHQVERLERCFTSSSSTGYQER